MVAPLRLTNARENEMTLILSNEEIGRLLPMTDCLDRLEETYREVGNARAVSRPRSDIYGPILNEGRYVFKTMDGVVPKYGVAAIRLNSDVIAWKVDSSGVRKEKQPLAAGGKWVGLVLLFGTHTGEPLAIMPDGVMQRLRVAATNALGAKYMTPAKSSIYALIGSGWQASGQAIAMAAVRPLSEIRIYSPTKVNRERLAAELRETLGIDVRAVEEPQAAVRGADIVGTATNSVTPVVELQWLEPHAHVTCVKELELGAGILESSSSVVVHARLGRPSNYIVGHGENVVYAHDPQEALADNIKAQRASRVLSRIDLSKAPDLGDLVTGKVPEMHSGITTFINTIGLGVQFAALGALALERAKAEGLGREIPTDWLLESVHP